MCVCVCLCVCVYAVYTCGWEVHAQKEIKGGWRTMGFWASCHLCKEELHLCKEESHLCICARKSRTFASVQGRAAPVQGRAASGAMPGSTATWWKSPLSHPRARCHKNCVTRMVTCYFLFAPCNAVGRGFITEDDVQLLKGPHSCYKRKKEKGNEKLKLKLKLRAGLWEPRK